MHAGLLDLWPFDLEPVRIIARGMGNLLTNFAVSGTFRSRLMGQHLSQRPRDLVTMTFDFGGHGTTHDAALHAPIMYQVPIRIGLSIRKIWHTFCLSISRSSDLDLWPWKWWALFPVRLATFLPILVFLWLFVLYLSVNTCHVTLRPSTLTLDVIALVGNTGLRTPSVYRVSSS